MYIRGLDKGRPRLYALHCHASLLKLGSCSHVYPWLFTLAMDGVTLLLLRTMTDHVTDDQT